MRDHDYLRMPTEHELRVARLMNIPTRGFCVGADLEKINAESYKYMYHPEEYEPPDLSGVLVLASSEEAGCHEKTE